MPFRLTIKTSPTDRWRADIDDMGKVSSGAGFPPVPLGQVPGFTDLVNSLITRLAATGWVSIEIEKT